MEGFLGFSSFFGTCAKGFFYLKSNEAKKNEKSTKGRFFRTKIVVSMSRYGVMLDGCEEEMEEREERLFALKPDETDKEKFCVHRVRVVSKCVPWLPKGV
jgi:hypothetical protein